MLNPFLMLLFSFQLELYLFRITAGLALHASSTFALPFYWFQTDLVQLSTTVMKMHRHSRRGKAIRHYQYKGKKLFHYATKINRKTKTTSQHLYDKSHQKPISLRLPATGFFSYKNGFNNTP
ncbi:MAG TPA: hypothetical protein VNS32_18600 [Flavisolibacter sp.]|nr:hypothetical protein [Flavisolibacter sp.]